MVLTFDTKFQYDLFQIELTKAGYQYSSLSFTDSDGYWYKDILYRTDGYYRRPILRIFLYLYCYGDYKVSKVAHYELKPSVVITRNLNENIETFIKPIKSLESLERIAKLLLKFADKEIL